MRVSGPGLRYVNSVKDTWEDVLLRLLVMRWYVITVLYASANNQAL
jgi:hypothetical protein